MLLKFGRAARVSAVLFSFAFLISFALSEQKEPTKEGHTPRTKAAQDADEDSTNPESGEIGDRENPRQREEWFMRGRQFQGRPASHLLVRALEQRHQLRLKAYSERQLKAASRAFATTAKVQTASTTGWTQLGPAPLLSVPVAGQSQDYGFVTGRVTSVAVDQGDPTGNTVYIGGAYGGVWKSTNAANPDPTTVTWKAITDDQATLAIGAIAIQPGNSNVVLVGTGEANSSTDSYYGLGILRSTDAGTSWTLITSANNGSRPFHGLAFAKFAFKSDNPSTVVAATAAASEGITVGAEQPANNTTACANSSVTATCRGLYYSTDAGQTWSQVTMVDPSGTPDNGSSSDVIYNPQEQKFYAWSRAHGLYTSSDGMTFTRAADQGTNVITQPKSTISLANCPTSPVNLQTCPIYRGQISQVPGRDEMYVWFVDSSTTPVNGGIYRTLDGGKTWVALNVSTITNCGDNSGCDTEQGDYNLVLTAVPNGSGTDLYAGAINIYRCQIATNNPTCSTSPFLNLTHVYGCVPTGSFSHVHPDQHSFDFLQSDPNIIYFGNDGGVYRTIASQNGAVVPSSCQGTAPSQPYFPFDNLNGTMGSMTQFVWFQQHPTDQFTFLGGTQDNGSPAIDGTNSGTNGVTWRSVMGGDGGWTDINPGNINEWFTENTRVSIHRCAVGTNCSDSQFAPVVTSAKVGADSAAFYMPFLLDPQNTSALILGTCRVWRTPSSGSGTANALSQTFDGSSTCSSTSPSLISALAAGGPKTASGSQVIYAGTANGHVWVTQSADTGTASWADRSPVQGGFQAPICSTAGQCQYPASGIALDPRDATGRTAFVTAMGFMTGHVYQTTDAGTTWTDISGDLPDAPANSVAVDPASGTVYVGTDIGVFSASSLSGGTTLWTEVGPATGQGTLPNVAVTRVAIFKASSTLTLLRASTYGRGIWEIPISGTLTPDFNINVSNSSQVTFPGQSVTYTGTISVFNGYSNTVTVSCAAASTSAPASCPSSPVTAGAFSLTVSDPNVKDFAFNIQGSDGTLTHQAAATLRVIDFALSAPSPNSTTVLTGRTTSVQSTVSSLGSFDQTVIVDCDPLTLPPGMSCNSSSTTLQSRGATPVSVTISAASSTQTGTYNVSLRGFSTLNSSHSVTHTQSVSVQVVPSPDFSMGSPTFTSSSVVVGTPLTTTVTLTPVNGYASTASLSCVGTSSGIAASACSFTPSALNLSSGAQTSSVTVDTSAGLAGSGQITIQSTDGILTHTVNVPFALTAAANADFSFNFTSQGVSAKAGAAITPIPLSVTSSGGFNGTISWGVSGCPQLATCTVSPISTTLGQAANLTITTTAPSVSSVRTRSTRYLALWLGMPFGAFGLVFLRRQKAFTLMTLLMVLGLAACGGGGGGGGTSPPVTHPGTPAGTYTIVVTGTSGTTVHQQNFTLTVQ